MIRGKKDEKDLPDEKARVERNGLHDDHHQDSERSRGLLPATRTLRQRQRGMQSETRPNERVKLDTRTMRNNRKGTGSIAVKRRMEQCHYTTIANSQEPFEEHCSSENSSSDNDNHTRGHNNHIRINNRNIPRKKPFRDKITHRFAVQLSSQNLTSILVEQPKRYETRSRSSTHE